MNRRAARLLTRLYPRAWRDRYAAEFEQFLHEQPGGVQPAANIVRAAVSERIFPTVGGPMQQEVHSFGTILRKPSAFLPLTMSLAALTTLAVAVAIGGGHIVREPDEGSVAHIWQLLMTVQMPIVLWFAVKWLRRAPRITVGVLALQAGAWLASCAPVYLLHL